MGFYKRDFTYERPKKLKLGLFVECDYKGSTEGGGLRTDFEG